MEDRKMEKAKSILEKLWAKQVQGQEGLEERVRILINPPPRDGRCQICGRHVSELKPFGGPGDPLVGDFTGAKLLKTFRDPTGLGCMEASWECSECIVLDETEYHEKLRETYEKLSGEEKEENDSSK